MHIHTLKNTDLVILTETFNKAFEGYFVPIKLSAQNLNDKIKTENIMLNYSVGVTIDGKLAGFILIGVNPETNTAYNSGTGIIAEFRGQKLTEKMYSYLLPKLNEIGIKNHLLEVICQNERALKVYENLGYTISRKLICYKGKISQTKKSDFKIETIEIPNKTEVKSFWNHNPSYQNSVFCIKNNSEKHAAFGAFDNEKLVGYIIFDKTSLRVKQFAVDSVFRKKGLGHQLFYQLQMQNSETDIVLINVDENDSITNEFLQKIGLNSFIEQYEMKLTTN